jgi:hypothetical protein
MTPNSEFLTMIEPVIDHSLSLLSGRVGREDTAHGIMAAIRRVRGALDEAGGDTATSLLDGAIRDRLILRNMRRHQCGEPVEIIGLPVPGPCAAIAEPILSSAAESCILYAREAPDLSGLLLAIFVLVDRLIEALGATPDSHALVTWLGAGFDFDFDDGEPERVPASLH